MTPSLYTHHHPWDARVREAEGGERRQARLYIRGVMAHTVFFFILFYFFVREWNTLFGIIGADCS